MTDDIINGMGYLVAFKLLLTTGSDTLSLVIVVLI